MPPIESVAPTQRHHFLGAIPISCSSTRFCVWAPEHENVAVHFPESGRVEPMLRGDDGYHMVVLDQARPGDRYFYRLSGTLDRPDPASRYQPAGVHGPSEIVDRNFAWSDQSFKGIELHDLIVYELHIGAFTDRGSFLSAIDRLDELVDLGINAIELMPVADAAGRWNWGYDGVCLFAPNRNYGTPTDFRRLVDAAHHKGLGVILDVVYNHLGPEGNYLADFGPYFSTKHVTPWGAAPNFDSRSFRTPIRNLFLANVVYWLDEFHIDALRVDAVHCTRDDSDPHIITEIGSVVKQWSSDSERTAKLIAESNVYDPELLATPAQQGSDFDAQWCDDFLHSLFAVVRPGEQLCHRAYVPGDDLERTLQSGFVYEGTLRSAPTRSHRSERIESQRLVCCIQNHDFIGNHPLGQRFHKLTSIDAQKAASALLILSPTIPMLFMGEEFACDRPFPFFVDFGDQRLREAVVQGRLREYPQHDWSDGLVPTDEQTFLGSKIGPRSDGDLELWKWYQSLIQVRKNWIGLGLLSDRNLSIETDVTTGIYSICYRSGSMIAAVAVRLVADSLVSTTIERSMPGEEILNSRPDTVAGLHANHAVVTFDQGHRDETAQSDGTSNR